MSGRRARFGAVLLAWADASEPGEDSTSALDRLGPAQVRRYAALSGLRARRFLRGRQLLVELAGELTTVADLQLTTTCEQCGAEHGRPRLACAPVEVSVSYAASVVAVAAVRRADAAAVGVDIEVEPVAGRNAPLDALARLFAPLPPPDIERWTLIEAALKADGRGVAVDVAQVQLGPVGSGAREESRAVRLPGRSEALSAAVIAGPAGFVLSAATAPGAGERHPESASFRHSAAAEGTDGPAMRA